MNENQPMQEKQFPRLTNNIMRFSEERDKMISTIDDILDHIIQNRPKEDIAPMVGGDLKSGVQDIFVNVLDTYIRSIDKSNERLANIIKRLNELI